MPTCPKCSREQYYWCDNPDCICRNIPANANPQINLLNDITACPYCGFAEHLDFWVERAMKALLEECDVETNFELIKKFNEQSSRA